MKTFLAILVSSFIFSGYSFAATCVSLGNGNWNTPSTWSCGSVPVGGDIITIQAGDTVRISAVTNITGAAVTINVDGVFLFDNPSAKLRLPCGSVIIISSTGSIQSEGVGQASHSIRICGDEVWSGSDGSLFGPLVIGILLPIELTYFDAEAQGSDIYYKWQTASETDNDFFNIEGSSDGMNWKSVARIEGAGTTQKVQDYEYTSSNPDQFEYFRLKQTDFDGNFSYSDIVAVELVRDQLVVHPNPSNGRELKIYLPSKESGILQILRYDGRIVYSKDLTGEKLVQLDDLDLGSGAYVIQIQQANQLKTERLIVQ